MSALPPFAALLAEVEGFFERLPDKPEENPELVLRCLWLLAAGRPVPVTRAAAVDLPDLAPAELDRLRSLLQRKREGTPLAHLTGRQEFLGLELLAGPEALIPRKETEIVGRAAIAKLRERAASAPALTVIDVCTGSGNLALAFAFHEPKARVFASDLSPEAISLARRNAEFTGLASRIQFRQGDFLAPFESPDLLGRCDLLSCNPPYISAGKVTKMPREISGHEPSLAFDGGPFGVSLLLRLLKEAPAFLKPDGVLCFEVGAGQGPSMEKQLRRLPWVQQVETHADREGTVRALVATRGGTP
ncbi:MAG TPA: HemK family protein methyltransferase [Planctomycetota bacterium]|nr:HemK family protein methyltransferase [Planctomycetota bacterium]